MEPLIALLFSLGFTTIYYLIVGVPGKPKDKIDK
jgi:hypothetical protein